MKESTLDAPITRPAVRRGSPYSERPNGLRYNGRRLLLAGLTLAAAACTAPATTHRPAAPALSQSDAAAPISSPAVPRSSAEQVLAAYRRFWLIAQDLDQWPDNDWPSRLSQVAAEPLLTRILDGLHGQVENGYRQFGTVLTKPALVDLTSSRASILDCQDASRSGEVDTSTGAITNAGRPRTPVAATLVRGADGHWRVTDARYLDTDC